MPLADNLDEFKDDISDNSIDSTQVNLEKEKSKWFSRGAKFENTGILFQSNLFADSYVESQFQLKRPCVVEAKFVNRSQDEKFLH